MTIYHVRHTINNCDDSDIAYWWYEHEPVSYHRTMEGAERRVQEKLQEELDRIPHQRVMTQSTGEQHNDYWNKGAEEIRNNITFMNIGYEGDKKQYPRYDIKEIELED